MTIADRRGLAFEIPLPRRFYSVYAYEEKQGISIDPGAECAAAAALRCDSSRFSLLLMERLESRLSVDQVSVLKEAYGIRSCLLISRLLPHALFYITRETVRTERERERERESDVNILIVCVSFFLIYKILDNMLTVLPRNKIMIVGNESQGLTRQILCWTPGGHKKRVL